MGTKPLYPEHEKLEKVQIKTQAIGDFIEWLGNKGIFLAEHRHSDYHLSPINSNILDLIAERYGIDRKKLDEEKLEMLNFLKQKP